MILTIKREKKTEFAPKHMFDAYNKIENALFGWKTEGDKWIKWMKKCVIGCMILFRNIKGTHT